LEQEDGYRRKAHNINQVVVIGKIKYPDLAEDNIREKGRNVKGDKAGGSGQKDGGGQEGDGND
jgi:hypothetical protein